MSLKIYYLKHISDFNFDDFKEYLVIKADIIKISNINNKIVNFSEYKNSYLEYDNYNNLIIVGISRIINPANRCAFINDYLSVMTRNKNKVIVDTIPFMGEPWRMFWGYQFSNMEEEIFNTNYSYPVENNYLKWFYRETSSSIFTPSILISLIKDKHFSELDILNSNFDFFEIDDIEKQIYNDFKDEIKKKYYTPKLIINELLKMCNNHFHLNFNFNSYLENRDFKLPDLKIYRFIVEENLRRMNIYNITTKEKK